MVRCISFNSHNCPPGEKEEKGKKKSDGKWEEWVERMSSRPEVEGKVFVLLR